MPNHTTRLILIALVTVLSACGFHLRGSLTLDLPEGVEPIYISSTNNSQLHNELRKLLTAYKVQLTTTASDANHQLIIIEQKTDRRTAAIGNGARAAEIQLTEHVVFELKNKQAENIFGPNTLIERRILKNDPNRVANTRSEETLLRREMISNLAAKIARQINAINYQQSPVKQTANMQPQTTVN